MPKENELTPEEKAEQRERQEQAELVDNTFSEEPYTQRSEESEKAEQSEESETPEELEEGEEDVSEEDVDDFLRDRVEAEEKEPGEEESKTPEELETPELENLELDEDTFEEVTSSHEKFTEFISKVQENAVKQTRAETQQMIENAREEILKSIPQVVQKSASRAQSVEQLRNQFFADNPVLKEKLPYVRDMTATVATQNPDWSAQEVLQEVGKRAKRDLNLSEQAKEREQQRKKGSGGPKFAGAGGRRAPSGNKDTRSKQEKMLDQTFGKQ